MEAGLPCYVGTGMRLVAGQGRQLNASYRHRRLYKLIPSNHYSIIRYSRVACTESQCELRRMNVDTVSPVSKIIRNRI